MVVVGLNGSKMTDYLRTVQGGNEDEPLLRVAIG